MGKHLKLYILFMSSLHNISLSVVHVSINLQKTPSDHAY